MAKLISLFNHKGGVSKTTTTFNLGWALADLGKRVLIVDGDPQCNLTGTVLGFSGTSDFEDFYNLEPNANLHHAVAPVFTGAASPLAAAEVVETTHEGLYLLAGHIDLALHETQLAVALSTGSAIPALQNLPGALGALLRLTSEENDIDYVLIDMSPSVGALNQCLLMSGDYFIVPTSPDYYCNQAIESLAQVVPRWNGSVAGFRDPNLRYPLPVSPPIFLGIISQRYRPRLGSPAASFQEWINRIKQTTRTTLVPALRTESMVVDETAFSNASTADTPYNIANIADFNTLIAQSQKHNIPVFALSDIEIERQGIVLEKMKASRDAFQQVFSEFANSVIALTA